MSDVGLSSRHGKGLAWIAVGLAVAALIALGAVASLIVISRDAAVRTPPPGTTTAPPAEDYRRIREEQSELLREYQWIDRDTGTVRIPIERAMKLIVERGSLDRAASTQ
jgi:hypothetical protein